MPTIAGGDEHENFCEAEYPVTRNTDVGAARVEFRRTESQEIFHSMSKRTFFEERLRSSAVSLILSLVCMPSSLGRNGLRDLRSLKLGIRQNLWAAHRPTFEKLRQHPFFDVLHDTSMTVDMMEFRVALQRLIQDIMREDDASSIKKKVRHVCSL